MASSVSRLSQTYTFGAYFERQRALDHVKYVRDNTVLVADRPDGFDLADLDRTFKDACDMIRDRILADQA